ncbi:MAG TPA: anti-sigma regulatory factor [Terriglobales bacterium]|nr:anti-sigma regulatory factor [Terriglobales bacterium]
MAGEIRVPIERESDIVVARQRGRSLAAELGFSSCDQTLIATAISEIARNILTYATKGEVSLSAIKNGQHCLSITAVDEGPGIANLDQAMQNGYSTAGSLGLGLPGAKRMMDEFEISSEPGKGTIVRMKKWKH